MALVLEDRKPVGVLEVIYGILPLDSEGMIDVREQKESMRLNVDMMPPVLDASPANVIEGQYRFAQKQFDDRFKWKPSPQVEKAILEALYG